MAKEDNTKTTLSPVLDFTKLLGKYKFPGVDFSAIVEREKKNIDALTQANKIAFEGWQALIRRQAEILQETMTQTMALAGKKDAAKDAAEVAKLGFEKALSNMRELAEMATKSQTDAFEIVRKRIGENVKETQALGKKK